MTSIVPHEGGFKFTESLIFKAPAYPSIEELK